MGLSDILGIIGGALKDGLSAVVAFINAQLAILWADIQSVLSALGGLAKWAYQAFSDTFDFIGKMWDWLRTKIIDPIISHVQAITDRVKKFLKPLTDLIKRYRKMMQDNYRLYVKPMIDFIQRIRRVLTVFRILGFKWAKQLDARLVKIETEIQSAFMASWKNLNILSDWVNFVVNPFGKLSQIPLLGAISDSIGAVFNMIWGKQNNPLSASDAQKQDADAHYYDQKIMTARFQRGVQIGLLPEDTDYTNAIRKASNDLGYDV